MNISNGCFVVYIPRSKLTRDALLAFNIEPEVVDKCMGKLFLASAHCMEGTEAYSIHGEGRGYWFPAYALEVREPYRKPFTVSYTT